MTIIANLEKVVQYSWTVKRVGMVTSKIMRKIGHLIRRRDLIIRSSRSV